MQFDYNETYQLMRKFHDLGKNETLIMDYLFEHTACKSYRAKGYEQREKSYP